jgi:epoxide hydrolase-like predicted phosphatase
MTKIKSIAFDLGGVVVGAFGKQLVEYASEKLGINQEELRPLMNIYEPELQTGKIDHITFWKKILSHKNKEIADDVLATLWMIPYEQNALIDEKMVDLIKELRKKYIVGLISNAQEPHNTFNRKRGLFDLFDILILSSEAGIRKPEKEIFELYLQKVNLKPEEVVFVDDEEKLLVNVENVGIKPIHFQGIEKLKEDFKKLGIE